MVHLQHVEALRDLDACFFCLGATSVGMSPEDYRRLTYDLTVAVARQLLPGNPLMVFEYISGEGTDAKSLPIADFDVLKQIKIRTNSSQALYY